MKRYSVGVDEEGDIAICYAHRRTLITLFITEYGSYWANSYKGKGSEYLTRQQATIEWAQQIDDYNNKIQTPWIQHEIDKYHQVHRTISKGVTNNDKDYQ